MHLILDFIPLFAVGLSRLSIQRIGHGLDPIQHLLFHIQFVFQFMKLERDLGLIVGRIGGQKIYTCGRSMSVCVFAYVHHHHQHLPSVVYFFFPLGSPFSVGKEDAC